MSLLSAVFPSSTGEGVALRIKSLLILLIPYFLNLASENGLEIAPDSVRVFIDSFFVVLFAVMQAWGWIRSIKK